MPPPIAVLYSKCLRNMSILAISLPRPHRVLDFIA